jgi:NAD(P)H-binding
MEDLLHESGLDWTIVRPPRLSNGPRTDTYRTAYGQNLPGGFRVSRADVADLKLVPALYRDDDRQRSAPLCDQQGVLLQSSKLFTDRRHGTHFVES